MNEMYGYDPTEYKDNSQQCIDMLSRYLIDGRLGLILGAGASMALGLPNWRNLTERCCVEMNIPFDSTVDNLGLKKLADKFKGSCSSEEEYISIIRKNLYKDVDFNFSLASKDLLTALTALFIGRTRGNVQDVITYNFDCVLEWYLRINGLAVNVISPSQLFARVADVNVVHVHGYLPVDSEYGDSSDFLIYSKKEFEDRAFQDSYWKDMLSEFLRRHIFLAVGASPGTLLDDLSPVLRSLTKWYKTENTNRGQPYGYAFLTKASDDEKNELLSEGIIPCELARIDIPSSIFKIAQEALKKSKTAI